MMRLYRRYGPKFVTERQWRRRYAADDCAPYEPPMEWRNVTLRVEEMVVIDSVSDGTAWPTSFGQWHGPGIAKGRVS